MAKSGITMCSEAQELYSEFSKIGQKPTHEYLIFKIEGENVVTAHSPKKGEKTYEDVDGVPGAYAEMRKLLIEMQSGYAFYSVNYTIADGARSKIVFITYADDNLAAKKKMLVSSTKEDVKLKCDNFNIAINANDADDFTYKEVLELAKKSSK